MEGQKIMTTHSYVKWAIGLTALAAVACSASDGGQPGERLGIVQNAVSVTEEATLTPSDGGSGDRFGLSTAVSGTTAIVGSYLHDSIGTDVGAAYVYLQSGTSWSQQQKLTPPSGNAGDGFGFSVAIDGDTAIVGAWQDDTVATDAGAAYVFTRSSGTWSLQEKLTPTGGAAGDFFGFSVAVRGDTAIVGAFSDDSVASGAGAAYVYSRSGSTWSLDQKLTPGDGGANDGFGGSVSLSGSTALVGSYFNATTGAAYVYSGSGGSWSLQQKLTASDGAANDNFGWSVSLSGESALVGAWGDDDGGDKTGSAYVFARSGGSWSEQAKLNAAAPVVNTGFGTSVALSGDLAMIGTDNPGTTYAYFFQRVGTTWTQHHLVSKASVRFGYSVALDGITGVAGAWNDGAAGAAYTYRFELDSNGSSCTTSAQCTSGFCVDGVCCENRCGDGATTDCLACSVSAGGTTDGLCEATTVPTSCDVPPGAVTLIAPTGTISTTTPEYRWQALTTATSYSLYVNDSQGNKVATTYTSVQLGCDIGSECAVTPSVPLQNGVGHFWVQASNASGGGTWGSGQSFTVNTPAAPTEKPTLLAPSGTITTNTPTYSWTSVATATQYYLWVNDSSAVRIQQVISSAAAGCSGGGNCSFTPATALFNGNAVFWVQAQNPNGDGPWSDPLGFTVDGPAPPGLVTLVSPSGPIGTNSPSYVWLEIPGATQYHVWVNDSVANRVNQVVTAGSVCVAGSCTLSPGAVLSSGNGRWWVQAQNANGNGPWGTGLAFSVP